MYMRTYFIRTVLYISRLSPVLVRNADSNSLITVFYVSVDRVQIDVRMCFVSLYIV